MRYLLVFVTLLFGNCAAHNERLLTFAEQCLPQWGELKISNGFVYVDIDDSYIYKLIPLIEEDGFQCPPYFGSKDLVGAHITVIYPHEMKGIDYIQECGETIHFVLKGCQVVKPLRWQEVEEVFLIVVEAPRLHQIREKYGLPKMEFDFHITVGVKRKMSLTLGSKQNSINQIQPVIILIGGYQGSGKTSVIEKIKGLYDINVISTDVIRQGLLNSGVALSPEFSTYVSDIYKGFLIQNLQSNSNIVIDANAHSKRIQEVDHLLREHGSTHFVIKVLLKASEGTLRERVKNRRHTTDCYQGTESDLEAALASIKIDPEEYDLILNTDNLSENGVFAAVRGYVYPYFGL